MWTKFSFVCNDCDSLLEYTTQKDLDDFRGWCCCGSPNTVMIEKIDATQGAGYANI